MTKSSVFLCLSLCFVVSLTNASLMNYCTEVPAQFPFDLSLYAGRWFLLAATTNSSVADCAQASNMFVPPMNNNKAMIIETVKYLKYYKNYRILIQ